MSPAVVAGNLRMRRPNGDKFAVVVSQEPDSATELGHQVGQDFLADCSRSGRRDPNRRVAVVVTRLLRRSGAPLSEVSVIGKVSRVRGYSVISAYRPSLVGP